MNTRTTKVINELEDMNLFVKNEIGERTTLIMLYLE
jgi:hypothetical protein